MWGGTWDDGLDVDNHADFNPPSPCGEGLASARYLVASWSFQSTLPVWGGTSKECRIWRSVKFQSTLPVWGGTWAGSGAMPQYSHFNPPSPCGEGLYTILLAGKLYYFNPPSPCGEGRCVPMRFQNHICISIHPPRVGRDQLYDGWRKLYHISIHPPRVGRDAPSPGCSAPARHFNPPSPCGEGLSLIHI